MKVQANRWAGTALALLMTSAHGASAAPLLAPPAGRAAQTGVILVQDQPADGSGGFLEELPRKKHREQPAEEKPAPAAEETAPAQEQPRTEEPKPERRKNREQPAAEQEQAPAAERQKPVFEQAPQEEEASPPPRKKRENAEKTQPAREEAPASGDQMFEPEQKKPERHKPKPATGQDAPDIQKTPDIQRAPAAEQPQGEKPSAEQPAPKPRRKRDAGQEVAPPADQQRPADKAPLPEESTGKPLRNGERQRPRDKAPAGENAPANDNVPAEDSAQPADNDSGWIDQQGGNGKPARQAPVFDSQKETLPGTASGTQEPPRDGKPRRKPEPAEALPPPQDDRAAQQDVAPVEIRPVDQEKGRRVDQAPDFREQPRPKGVDVLKEIGNRVIIQLNDQVMVESDDQPRMARGARDVYYEDLPNGRTRETIERGNGVRVVTIRDRYGDIVRRSRLMPDGREYVLSYVQEDRDPDLRDWRDPGDDLPPMRLNVPVDDYILDSEDVRDPDRYYEFLDQPPVERVERLYSVDEVKRSARIRDKTRRIDLDTINFDFGSDKIDDSEVPRLEGVANAIEKLLKQNPAETFLIEGHTDAVGSDLANLALSDRRAESVADALTNVFGIPPENLTTQGYGEQFLKVRTQGPERQNRRVAIRRITPLVAPVASNQ